MDMGKMLMQDRQIKGKPKKNPQNVDPHENRSRECSPANASCSSPANANREEEEADIQHSWRRNEGDGREGAAGYRAKTTQNTVGADPETVMDSQQQPRTNTGP